MLCTKGSINNNFLAFKLPPTLSPKPTHPNKRPNVQYFSETETYCYDTENR